MTTATAETVQNGATRNQPVTSPTLDQPFPPGVPAGDPVSFLRSVVATITAYRQRRQEQYPDEFARTDFGAYLREAAILEAVEAHPEAEQADLYNRLTQALQGGTPVSNASPLQLRVDALALFGWARDLSEHGNNCRSVEMWQAAAEKVLGGYSREAAKA